MKRRLKWLAAATVLPAVLLSITVLLLPAELELSLGFLSAPVRGVTLVSVVFATGLLAGFASLKLLQRGKAHDPKLLLPILLNKRLRQAIDDGYKHGELERALQLVEREAEREPNSLGHQYWRLRLLLDTGQTDVARAAMVRLLPDLPEVALTIRWGLLFEAAGEQDLWIRNVLSRIRDGLVVRRSTFRELIRMLSQAGRSLEALEVLQRLRNFDPPTPEEESELAETEMMLRIRIAKQLSDEGKFEAAMAEVHFVRARFSGWVAPYQVGFCCLKAQGDIEGAAALALEGFRNSGQVDLLLGAYEAQAQILTPIELLAKWDDDLSDLADDGWYQLTTGWIALRHGIVEEGVKRLQEIASDDQAYAHAQIVLGGMNIERGHIQAGSAMLMRGNRPWMELPFLFACNGCGQLDRRVPVICGQCGAFQSFRMLRPFTVDEPNVTRLVSYLARDKS